MNLTLRRSIVAAAVLVAVPVLSSCGSNFNAPTDQVYNPGVGVNERSSDVDVLHALVVSGAEGSGTVVAALVNQNVTEEDQLTGITATEGEQVDLSGPIEIGPEKLVQLADEQQTVSIEGEGIRPGLFVELTFEFANAESVTVEVPVVARRGDFAEVPVPSVAPTTEAPAEESGEGETHSG
ncbi:MAG TPA: hypothetical protein VLA97_15260 [Nocardioidaceae bacterium]|nr:hypothetical protein [Nocardioidaceae bacterium]